MTDSNIYENLLRDIVAEINEIAASEAPSQDSEFERGYRAGMMVIMKAIQDEFAAFKSPEVDSLNLIDVDEWFGKDK